ncbi:hypothetical protein FNB15_11505 [Ferrovibrio terrae]|uniref:Uncharacterized protein n=1 Tax=Ferrovibrio terrae TaxID=2594003 RepID=A0A516H254_9PROT|nr:hypothetical protein [Ferrovibrio terrae]QDO97854.1 hypothetical protein FNB15_11505 [Ferrovibrio terrae]
MKAGTSWADKLRDGKQHQVKVVPINIAGMKKGQMMLVPSARIVDAFIRRLPEGRLLDTRELRARLARKYHTEVTCPITMGFILRIVAEAAWEARQAGAAKGDITPVWRVLDEDSLTLKKLPKAAAAFFHTRRAEEAA